MDTDLQALARRVLTGDPGAAFELVSRVPESSRHTARTSFELLSASAFEEMLRNPSEFMAFKSPDTPAEVDPALFMRAIDASNTRRAESVREVLRVLDLAQLFTVLSTAKHLTVQLDGIPLKSTIALDLAAG